jgi:hypothetical protein
VRPAAKPIETADVDTVIAAATAAIDVFIEGMPCSCNYRSGRHRGSVFGRGEAIRQYTRKERGCD